jgi:hypothetical protein
VEPAERKRMPMRMSKSREAARPGSIEMPNWRVGRRGWSYSAPPPPLKMNDCLSTSVGLAADMRMRRWPKQVVSTSRSTPLASFTCRVFPSSRIQRTGLLFVRFTDLPKGLPSEG